MSSIHKVLEACSCSPPLCHVERAKFLHNQLISGIPYPQLGGKRIRQSKDLIRFKIGRDWRLLYQRKGRDLVPYCLITRQQFEQILKRRCGQR
jgi:hypothetical protein